MRPPTSDVPRSRAERAQLALAVTLLGTTGFAAESATCMFSPPPDDSATVSIELGSGASQDFTVDVFERRDEEGQVVERSCYATVAMPLSAFPSVSNRLDTGAVARAIQESAVALGVETCDVTVYYDDPEEVLGLGERCVQATYGFAPSNSWLTSSEHHCWSDEEIAEWQEMERLAEAEADAWAAQQEALEQADELGEEFDDALTAGAYDMLASNP